MTQIQNQTQVTVIVNQQPTVVNKPQVLVQTQTATKTALNTEDNFESDTPKRPTSPMGVVKLISGGALVGGGISSVATVIAKRTINETYEGPGLAGVVTGVAIGAGLGLLNIETEDKTLKTATKSTGGTLLGLGITGVAQAIGKAMLTDVVHDPSVSGVLLGAAIGGGIAMVNNDLENKNANNIKNVVGTALIGGGIAGLSSALIKTVSSGRLMGYSPVAMGIGMAVGAGVGLLNAKD